MKKVFFTVMCIGAVYAADASYLYWQVNGDTPGTSSDWDFARLVAANVEGDTAAISAWNSSGKRSGLSSNTIIDENVSSSNNQSLGSEIAAPMPVGVVANIGDLTTGYAYYVELINSTTGYLYARSDAVAYSALNGHVTDELSVLPIASLTPWHASGYTVVPEPTSAMLMLFGAAFLGLKRKNRRIA